MSDIYLGVDPGKATGFALVTVEDQKIIERKLLEFNWEMATSALISWERLALQGKKIKLIVMEDFKLFKHKADAQVGSNIPASQMIGAVKYAAKRMDVPLVLQAPGTQNDGATLRGEPWTGGHMPNEWSAFNHLYYYLVTKDIIEHPIFTNPPKDNYGGIFG